MKNNNGSLFEMTLTNSDIGKGVAEARGCEN